MAYPILLGVDFSNKQAGSYGSGLTLRFGFDNNRAPTPVEWSIIIKAASHLKTLDWVKELTNIPDLMKRSSVHGHQ
ncbi:MAG: hypothetical protein K2X98_03855 [Alphaproteobacteria bacterium]|nr:hypothetical protein [Alphaproteobacteria bacterium]